MNRKLSKRMNSTMYGAYCLGESEARLAEALADERHSELPTNYLALCVGYAAGNYMLVALGLDGAL
jgi:hypothetical protein